MRLDFLSLAFTYRRYFDDFLDFSEFGIKDCLTTSSLGWKLLMSLGQEETPHTYNHQYTRYFIREAGYRGRVGSNIREPNSSHSILCTEIQRILQNHLKSNSQHICNVMREKKYHVFTDELGNAFDKKTGGDDN